MSEPKDRRGPVYDGTSETIVVRRNYLTKLTAERDALRAALTASVPMSPASTMGLEQAMEWAAGLRLIDASAMSHKGMVVLADEVLRLRSQPDNSETPVEGGQP